MKLLPMLLTNLLCVGVGIGAYDLIKSNDQAAPTHDTDVSLLEGSDLVERVRQLEAAAPSGPLLTGTEAPALSKDDVLDLIRKHVPAAPALDESTGVPSTTSVAKVAKLPMAVKSEDVTAFRALLDEVEKQRRTEREEERAKATEQRMISRLDRLELGLNDSQKSDILKIQQAHRQKMRDTFTKLRESGAGRDEYRAAMEPMREELTKAVENVVPGEDATKVVQALGGGGGGMRGGFDRGGRNRNR